MATFSLPTPHHVSMINSLVPEQAERTVRTLTRETRSSGMAWLRRDDTESGPADQG
jgi:hypothetical protein